MTPTLRQLLIPAFAASGMVFAQTAPDAGQLLREIEPALSPRVPAPEAPELKVTSRHESADSANTATIVVRSISITGNTVVPDDVLRTLLADAAGQEFNLAQLQALAARITAAYQARGYLLARAYLPAQEVKEGHITIAVQEGRLGQIRIENSSRLSTNATAAFLASLEPDAVLTAGPLETGLLLLSDTPGVIAYSSLEPGDKPGTADLVVNAAPDPLISGRLGLDNYGGESTGPIRVNALLNVNGPFHLGDRLSLQGLSSLDSGQHLRYGRASYDLLLNGHGTRLGFAYAWLDYGLGQNFAALDATGTADVASLYLSHPLVRTRSMTVQAIASYEYKTLQDGIATAGIHNDRDLNIGSVGINTTLRDGLFGGGSTSASLLVGLSEVHFTDATAAATDAAGARTEGTNAKLILSLERWQSLGSSTILHLSANGQYSGGNLDSSDKFSLGGPTGVRAYPQGETSGDDGYTVTAELRQNLPLPTVIGNWQALAFYDAGQVRFNHDALPVGGANSRSLSGAGVGLRWNRGNWSATADVAWRIEGGVPNSASDDSPRGWLSLAYQF